MPCGRESRSAAVAGVPARRLSPLVLMFVLFSVMPRRALSRSLALPPLPAPVVRNITCNTIPYPFGVRGRSLPGFEVTCGRNKEAMLEIKESSYKIDYVSVENAFVVILAGPISQVCYDRNGKQTPATGIGNISLDGTPFTFSKRNKLVAIGCNYGLSANFSNSMPGHSQWQLVNCNSFCNGNSCPSDAACCEDTMPMDAAQEFTLTFDKLPGQFTGDENGICSAAFFYDQDEQIFKGGQDPLKDPLFPGGDHAMILDWAVGQGTCDQALTYNLMSVCNSLSDCIDAPRGVGYLCKCNAGYDGNPYTAVSCEGTQ